jgi:hypothetical protein
MILHQIRVENWNFVLQNTKGRTTVRPLDSTF